MISEKDVYGWNSTMVKSGEAELAVPQEIGPRIVWAGFSGEDNLFKSFADQRGGAGEDEWQVRGGHRLWHAPENMPRTYQADNFPIIIAHEDAQTIFCQAPAADNAGIFKTIRITALGNETFRIEHGMRNDNQWPIETAPWALSVMEKGGKLCIPLPPKAPHGNENLLPASRLVLWSYTDLSHPVFQFGSQYLGMDTQHGTPQPQKIGVGAYPGWVSYWQETGTFVNYTPYVYGARYPDHGSAYESFCNADMIEVETLAPLHVVECGQTVSHTEYWKLFRRLPRPDSNDAFEEIKASVEQWIAALA